MNARSLAVCRFVGLLLVTCPCLAAEKTKLVRARELDRGRELFTRVWQPRDPRSPDGDGLGPMFNDVSCVACHFQGGVGGGGPAEKNAQILVLRKRHGQLDGSKLHPGLLFAGGATVLHRSSIRPSYAKWRDARLALADARGEPELQLRMLAAGMRQDDPQRVQLVRVAANLEQEQSLSIDRKLEFEGVWFTEPPLLLTERNPPALFGASLLDAIGDEAIAAAARRQQHESPQIAGKVSRRAAAAWAASGGRLRRPAWRILHSRPAPSSWDSTSPIMCRPPICSLLSVNRRAWT